MFECGVLDDLRDRLAHDLVLAVPAFLEGAGLPRRAATPHLLLDVADEADAVRRMAEHGVHVGAGAAFDALTPSIRVCLLGVDADAARIAGQTFARLAEEDARR